MQSAILIFNPAAGDHRALDRVPRLITLLARGGYDAEPRPTASAGDATRLAREAAAAGADAVFALGGDGTLREAAAGLIGSETNLGFLPTGTANVMTFALGLPMQTLAAAERVDRLEPIATDVGWCEEEPFLMMASAGLDGAALRALDPALKRRFGRAGVGLTAVGAWWRYDYPVISVEAEGTTHEASLVVAANIPYYGGSLRIAPEASAYDGLLDVVLFRGIGRRAALSFAFDLARGRHLARKDTQALRTDSLRLLTPESVAGQIDGDPRSLRSPVAIHVQRGPLRLLAEVARD